MAFCHRSVICRECSEGWIYGTRYRSKRHQNYNLCQMCFLLKHKDEEDDFAVYKDCLDVTKAREQKDFPPLTDVPPVIPKSIRLGVIDHPNPIYASTTRRIEHLEVVVHKGCSVQACTRFQSWVANHTALESLAISIYSAGQQAAVIEGIVTCLLASASLRSVSVELRFEVEDATFISQQAARAVSKLVAHKGSLQHLALQVVFGYLDFGLDEEDQMWWSTLSPLPDGNRQPTAEEKKREWFSNMLLDAVAGTGLTTFAFDGFDSFSELNKEQACKAMVSNPHLKRLKVNNFRKADYMLLDFLAADKQGGWMKQWTSLNNNEHGKALEQALDFPLADSNKLHILYRFLRERPDLLVQQTGKVLEMMERDKREEEERREREEQRKMEEKKRQEMEKQRQEQEKKEKERREQEKKKKRKEKRRRKYYCWCCKEEIKGDTLFKLHLESGPHRRKHCALVKEENTSYHCWCCNRDFQGGASYGKHLRGKKHKRKQLGSGFRKEIDPKIPHH